MGRRPSRPHSWNVGPAGVHAGLLPAAGWELEAGGRYFGSWGQFHKDFGQFTTDPFPPTSDVSRLTYNGLQSNTGEFFGRIDTPWNLFRPKGYIGGGGTNSGHLNDEDFVDIFRTCRFRLFKHAVDGHRLGPLRRAGNRWRPGFPCGGRDTSSESLLAILH